MWSRNVNELVSTHGYSLNQVIVWKYPSMQKIATLTGHSLRYECGFEFGFVVALLRVLRLLSG
jgi:WD40 repeat protein